MDKKRLDSTVRLTIEASDYGRPGLTPIVDAIFALLNKHGSEVIEVRIELDLLDWADLTRPSPLDAPS